jgi:TonB family protein
MIFVYKDKIMKLDSSRLITLIFVFLLGFFNASAQTDREKGVELFKQGKSQEAINTLKKFLKNNPKDGDAWNILGLVYLKTNDSKNSIKSFQKAIDEDSNNSDYRSNLGYVYLLTNKTNEAQDQLDKSIKLNPQNANAYYFRGLSNMYERKYDDAILDADRAIQIDKIFSAAFILKSNALIYKFGEHWEDRQSQENKDLLSKAVTVLESCVGQCKANDKSNEIAKQRENIRAFYEYLQKGGKIQGPILPTNTDGETGVKVIRKAFPRYTDAARNANISGTVNLAILFGSDAKIKFIVVTKSLGYGLDEQAIKAATNIQFEPATRDGQAISVIKLVQYSFRIGR